MHGVSIGLVFASVGAALGSLLLVRWVWPYRDRPGAKWLLGVFSIQTVTVGTYAVGFFIVDRSAKVAAELLFWAGTVWVGTFFLAFALSYTGRGHLLRTRWSALVGAAMAILTATIVTTPIHGLFWSDFTVQTVHGLSTVSYVRGNLLFVVLGIASLAAGMGAFLLFDTVVSYGPLYRGEALAVATSTIPPAAGLFVWAFAIEPLHLVNLTPALFLPHVVLDAYAFVYSDLFEFDPATRREGERTAIDDVATPIVIVDHDGRIVNLNRAAERLMTVEKRRALGEPLGAQYNGDRIEIGHSEQSVTITAHGRRLEFNVASKPLEGPSGRRLGHTLVFQDVTEERQRKQRLEVLNRILRHNLRNDMTTITGFAEIIADRTDDEVIEEYANNVIEEGTRLVEVGNKVRQGVDALDREHDRHEIVLSEFIQDVTSGIAEDRPDATVSVDVAPNLRIETVPELLALVIENLVENAIVHGDRESPSVVVTLVDVDRESEQVILEIRDDGPGIDPHEIAAIQEGTETSLQHGSGIGLWLVEWAVRTLGGELSFGTTEAGTAVELRLPGLCTETETTEADGADERHDEGIERPEQRSERRGPV